MSKLPNIIQRRELEPLLLKAGKIAKHYENAANCTVSVMSSDWDNICQLNPICSKCSRKSADCSEISSSTEGVCPAYSEKTCKLLHMEAVNEARMLGGSYTYTCSEGFTFWTSPFYSGKRFAGALISGGLQESEKNNARIQALANMTLICAEQISSMSFAQKNMTVRSENLKNEDDDEETAEFSDIWNNENNACLIDMERNLLANLRRGDNNEANKILAGLLNKHYLNVNCNISAFRLKALELAVLLSRSASDSGDSKDGILETNDRYLKKIGESSSLHELKEILFAIVQKISGKIFSFHGVRHFPALRKAERFIWENYTRKLSLQEIADVSGLSAPYFSTIFKEEMGENLSNYLNRLRVEKAATLLITTDMSICEIAKTCGFEDQSWFSKIFKNNTGITPGKYRDLEGIVPSGSITGLSA